MVLWGASHLKIVSLLENVGTSRGFSGGYPQSILRSTVSCLLPLKSQCKWRGISEVAEIWIPLVTRLKIDSVAPQVHEEFFRRGTDSPMGSSGACLSGRRRFCLHGARRMSINSLRDSLLTHNTVWISSWSSTCSSRSFGWSALGQWVLLTHLLLPVGSSHSD